MRAGSAPRRAASQEAVKELETDLISKSYGRPAGRAAREWTQFDASGGRSPELRDGRSGRVLRRVADQAADRGAGRESGLLDRAGDARSADVVEVLVRDDGHAHRVRHALLVRLAVGGEGEHRLEEGLELEGGADLRREACLVGADVLEAVDCAGLDSDGVALVGHDLLAVLAELD